MPISWMVGVLFGVGLATSGMLRRSKINNFLTIYENWDPSLMLVMGGAVGVNIELNIFNTKIFIKHTISIYFIYINIVIL